MVQNTFFEKEYCFGWNEDRNNEISYTMFRYIQRIENSLFAEPRVCKSAAYLNICKNTYICLDVYITIKLHKMADNAVFILDVSYEIFSTFQILRDIHSVFIAAD